MGRRTLKGQRGAALVEFALVLPVLLLILLGIIEFGFLLYNQHVITNASREGARYGIVVRTQRRTVAEIDSVVQEYCRDHLITFGNDSAHVDVLPDPTDGALFGEDLLVEVSFRYDFLVLPGFLGSLVGGTDLDAYTSMKYE